MVYSWVSDPTKCWSWKYHVIYMIRTWNYSWQFHRDFIQIRLLVSEQHNFKIFNFHICDPHQNTCTYLSSPHTSMETIRYVWIGCLQNHEHMTVGRGVAKHYYYLPFLLTSLCLFPTLISSHVMVCATHVLRCHYWFVWTYSLCPQYYNI